MASKQNVGYELHEHYFVSGPRSSQGYRNGVWCEIKFSHSHPGGSIPHRHPDTGPAFYGYRKSKFSKRSFGEQFELVPLTEEENTFVLHLTDSGPTQDTPFEALRFPPAQRMMRWHRMKCIVRDERRKQANG
jgi:hypothetical protein